MPYCSGANFWVLDMVNSSRKNIRAFSLDRMQLNRNIMSQFCSPLWGRFEDYRTIQMIITSHNSKLNTGQQHCHLSWFQWLYTIFQRVVVLKGDSNWILIKLLEMSFSITPSQTIRKAPTNTSPSKEIHMFSKTKRFPAPNPECPNAFYSYDSQLSQRKASFGYGNKSDFTRTLTASPPATKYNLSTFVDMSIKKGKSFGAAREKLPDRSYLIPQLHKVPGPGQYEGQKLKSNNFYFTTRPKTIDMVEKNLTWKLAPGPGSHSDVDFYPKNGRLSISKYSDHPLSTIHPKTERFQKIKQSPGPSSYKEGDSINGDAKYMLSHRKSNGRRVFSKTARDGLWTTTITPGPGAYMETSEFGHYGSSQYYKTLNK